MSQPIHLDDHRRHRTSTPTVTYERRGALLKQHDAQVCACGHRCVTHGSYNTDRRFVGVGLGPCGWPRCDCDQFRTTGASSTTITPIPDYDREPSDDQINHTCDDCQAPPGEPCHWACSTWWT